MSNSTVEQITSELRRVAEERHRRTQDHALGERVLELKAYQQRRFAVTHAEALNSPRYNTAARFFLEHLYGPADFSRRDSQFERVVPALVRLFPSEVVQTVASLASLHAISERLDTLMASHFELGKLDRPAYVQAWQATGHFDQRELQIALSLRIGESLDRLTRNPLIRHSLRMMRGPAKAAGLSDLQVFLEAGFDAFRAMRGAREFLDSIGRRERSLAAILNSHVPDEEHPELASQLP